MLSPPGSARRPWHSAPKEGHANHSFLRGPWRLRCNRPECVNAAVVGAGGDLEAIGGAAVVLGFGPGHAKLVAEGNRHSNPASDATLALYW